MARIALALVCLLGATACLPGLPAVPLNAARDPAQDVSSWPAADAALHSASAVMSQLTTLREKASTRTYRNDEPFLSVDAERAYVAPDRRYEKVEGRSAVEAVDGETVQIGARFFKRVGKEAGWQQLAWTESFGWPAREYLFGGLRKVSYAGLGEDPATPARGRHRESQRRLAVPDAAVDRPIHQLLPTPRDHGYSGRARLDDRHSTAAALRGHLELHRSRRVYRHLCPARAKLSVAPRPRG
jgi:hypothetical protein